MVKPHFGLKSAEVILSSITANGVTGKVTISSHPHTPHIQILSVLYIPSEAQAAFELSANSCLQSPLQC